MQPPWQRLFGPWVAQLSRASLRADGLAGLLGALLVLPQAIAFATLAGLPPQYGLYTAVVPCVVAALFGSSWQVVSGPTNALSLALAGMLAPLALAGSEGYVQLALVLTLLVGLIQLGVGVLRLGALANFISPAVLLGFTSGAALLIAVYAAKGLLQPGALIVGGLTLAAALLARRWAPRWPFMLVGLLVGAGAAAVLNRSGLVTPVALLGSVPSPWPTLQVPHIDWHRLPDLLGLAFALTIVALGQSIAIAKAIAQRTGQHIDANREFVGQGLSNVVGGFFSCYVSCGSLNRSLPNLEAGARTHLAAVFSGGLVLVLVAASAPWLALIPMAAISGLLLLVAASLLDPGRWRMLERLNRAEFGTAAATCVATLAIRLEIAILFGTLLSLLTYLYRTARPAMRSMGFDTMAAERRFVVVEDTPAALPECPQLKLLRMEGSVYFGATPHVAERLHALRSEAAAPQHLLVMAKSMNFIDLAGAELWQAELRQRRAMGGALYFHRPRPEVLKVWQRNGFLDELGQGHVFPDKRSAIASIFATLDREVCARCSARIFHECASLGPGPLSGTDRAEGGGAPARIIDA